MKEHAMPEILTIFLYIILRAAIYGIVAIAALFAVFSLIARAGRRLRHG